MIHDRSQLQRRNAYSAQDLQAEKRLPASQKTAVKTIYQSSTSKQATVDLTEKNHGLGQAKKIASFYVQRSSTSFDKTEIFRNIRSAVSNSLSSLFKAKSPQTQSPQHPAVVFQAAFNGQKFPSFDDVKKSKNQDPKIFNACISMLEGTMVGNAISFMEEFDKLQSHQTLEGLIQLKENYVIDPSKDDPFDFSNLKATGLNIYQTTYDNFDAKFKNAILELNKSDRTGDLSGVLAAFKPVVDVVQADTSKNFYQSAQAAISKYYQSQPSSGQPSPSSFA